MKKLIFCILVGFAITAHADLYKCVGKDGTPKYQVTKCPGNTESKTIKIMVEKISPADRAAALARAVAAKQEISPDVAVIAPSNTIRAASVPAPVSNVSSSNAQLLQGLDMTKGADRLKAKYLTGGFAQPSPASVSTTPQYVPSINQWCQVTNGVTNCWK